MSPENQRKILEDNGYIIFKGNLVNPRNQVVGVELLNGGFSVKDPETEHLLETANIQEEMVLSIVEPKKKVKSSFTKLKLKGK